MIGSYSLAAGSVPVSEAGIRRLVELFYGRVRRDTVLGPVFTRALGTSDATWGAHFARLTDFWSSLMLRSGRYHGDPFSAHLRLPDIKPAMFDRWLALFHETCRELFEPEVARAFGERAERVARSLRMGLFERLPASHLQSEGEPPADAGGCKDEPGKKREPFSPRPGA